jgi:hypothetical protein
LFGGFGFRGEDCMAAVNLLDVKVFVYLVVSACVDQLEATD